MSTDNKAFLQQMHQISFELRELERSLTDEALLLWSKKPKNERAKRRFIFWWEEDLTAKNNFIYDYLDKHF